MFGRRLVELNRLSSVLTRRQRIHLASRLLKWVSAEETKRISPIAVGSRHGHPEDPEINTFDVPYYGTPGKGDMIKSNYYYRDFTSKPKTHRERILHKILSTFIWWWIFYRLYYDHGMIIGHGYAPYLEEFTDEELGIPPDDAPDPEYWGDHEKPYGTYR